MDASSVRPLPCGANAHESPCPSRRRVPSAEGFALIEVMVTMVLLSIGLLGLAGLQARTSVMEMESYQRTQALILAQDMAERIQANKANAAGYVGDDFGIGRDAGCAGSSGVRFDLCSWSTAIRGAAEKSGTVDVGALLGGRGCVVAATANLYQVIVVWQGLMPTVPPAARCGRDRYGVDSYRRAVIVPVWLARLQGV